MAELLPPWKCGDERSAGLCGMSPWSAMPWALAAVPVTLSVWTLNGPAVDLWWAWDVPGDLVPLENRIRLVTCRSSVRQAARVYSLIKP
jgi:hypothetical protein